MSFVRTPPKPPMDGATKSHSPKPMGPRTSSAATDHALDELTALFLTSSTPASHTGEPHAVKKPIKELLITGHMPVRGNLWVAPYADAIGARFGCCALVTMSDPDELSLQVLYGDVAQTIRGGSARQTIDTLSSTVNTWLIRPSTPVDLSSIVTSGADRITILTGTDGIAVVAAYKLIKDLSVAADEEGIPLDDIGVVVVGADEDAAREMVRRLNHTASSFLKGNVQLRMWIDKMDAGTHCTQHITIDGEACPSARDVFKWIDQAHTTADYERPYQPNANDRATDEQCNVMPEVTPQIQAPSNSSHSHDRSYPSAKLHPKVNNETEASSSSPRPEGLLASNIAGLTPLSPRCPGHESIELAVDANGTVHLLGQEQCLREIRIVKAWVKSHASLIAMACSEHTIRSEQEMICHIFSATPASLADLHGTGLRLHVLAPVTVGEQTAWYVAPLN